MSHLLTLILSKELLLLESWRDGSWQLNLLLLLSNTILSWQLIWLIELFASMVLLQKIPIVLLLSLWSLAWTSSYHWWRSLSEEIPQTIVLESTNSSHKRIKSKRHLVISSWWMMINWPRRSRMKTLQWKKLVLLHPVETRREAKKEREMIELLIKLLKSIMHSL